ncbi:MULTISPECIES: EamA family transporter [unclassified Solwaraspora]|uniref:EamA family transporter n=1 Tax=unclassified Solwaraspora TaxID=2627926 RepID=UPI00248BEE3B|nr:MULTISPECIES: EamA family transporter [unclassified Solwaraspora]WBB96662.1 EamA family transporter [Solwaraspora sp. WMMA2059]WBC19434.1 EamA family transporter [Solwaraspora sp. WMMA2080]WJK32983.1 EamA family transporter [Solwaraspora sp. WMMA2065]
MSVGHLALGVLVTAVWGFNFVVIRVGLDSFDPYLLATLRFAFCCLPAIFFFRRPRVPIRYLVAYGLVLGVFQFGLLFAGIDAGLSAGLASIVLQLQVFFTIGFASLVLRERVKPVQGVGMALAAAGMVLIATAVTDGSATVTGVLLVTAAAASWGAANIIAKRAATDDILGFIVWSSLIPPVPLFLLTLLLSGPESVVDSLRDISWTAAASVLYLVYPTTLFGYAVWNWLLRRHTAALVAPLTLLVPLFGMGSSVLVLGEQLTATKLIAGAMVVLGLVVTQIPWHRLGRWAVTGSPPASLPTQPAAPDPASADPVDSR